MITRLKNIYWLYGVNKNINKLKNEIEFRANPLSVALRLASFYNSFTRKKFKIERNLVASILKQVRKEYPYQVKGETEAEKLYKEYFTLDNHIPNFETLKKGNYVKRFRNSYPSKGVKYCEYYLNFCSTTCDIYKITGMSEHGSWKLEDFKGSYWVDSIHDYEIPSFLFATKEEIERFKARKKEYKEIEKEISFKSKEINKLRIKQHKL